MDILKNFFDILIHLDTHLLTFVAAHGAWAYALLFIIIFCETGFIVVSFLPGDSLLFAAGTIAANTTNSFNVHVLLILLVVASILGNCTNYAIGRYIGPKVFKSGDSWLLNKRHLLDAQAFYKRHGAQTIIIARFIPVIRSFAPFVAGIGSMPYDKFFFYNFFSGILWVSSLLYASYFFGGLPIIKNNFTTVIFCIIGISVMPIVIGLIRRKINSHSHS